MAKNLMIRYVFESRPNELKRMVVKYGLTPAQNQQDLWKKVNYVVMKFPQDALKDIVAMHPDKDIILKLSGNRTSEAPEKSITETSPITKESIEKLQGNDAASDKKSSACGCSGSSNYSGCNGGSCKCGTNCGCNKTSSADGRPVKPAETKPESTNFFKEHTPLIVIGTLALAGGLLLWKHNKSLMSLIGKK